PVWFKNAFADLISVTDDAAWKEVCHLWIGHERRLGFNENVSRLCNRLPVEKRPGEITYWFGRGRKYDKPPQIIDVEAFGKTWRAWWQSMQPEWRTTSWPPQTTSVGNAADWDVLNRGGPCVIYLVLVCLKWW
ncbi:hypothetical protein BDY19DRAFT_856527, partial [Irpex rosettiformis]